MSKKSDLLQKLVKRIDLPHDLPSIDVEGTLLERGMYAVLLRELPPARAKSSIAALGKTFDDYNETRVSQAQEIAEAIAPKGKGTARLQKYLPAARLVKKYLQTIFQETHGLDLEEMNTDPVGMGRTLSSLEFVGGGITSYLLYMAEDGEMPVLSGSVRVLDRLGLMTRTSSVRKARESMAGLVATGDRLSTAYALGMVVDGWCDSRKPMCWDCPLLDACPNGKKVHADWIVQQERLAKQHEKEQARAAIMAQKEAARQKRQDEREGRAQAAADKKAVKERDKKKKALLAKAEVVRLKKDAIFKKEQAKKDAVAKKKADADKKTADAAQKKADSKKKAGAKKKAEADKVKASAKKEAAPKKAAASKKKPDAKKPAAKKPAAKKPAAKKPAAKKPAAKKPAAKKPAAKKPAPKKPAPKKPAPKKPAPKKPAPKKEAKKATKKTAKKVATKKKATKKKVARRK